MTNDSIDDLIEAFAQRDRVYQKLTYTIADVLHDSILEGLIEFLGVPQQAVTWGDIQLDDTMIMLTAVVTYTQDDNVPALVEELAPTPQQDTEPVSRMVYAKIPISMAFAPASEIAQFLVSHAYASLDEAEAGTFDTDPLTESQKSQLDILQRTSTNTGRGKVH